MGRGRGTVICEGLAFPECPRWRDGRLWFSDMVDQRVAVLEPDGTVATMAEVDDRPAGLGMLSDGTVLITLMFERRLLRLVDGEVRPFVDLGPWSGPNLNDMVVDSQDRAYVTSGDRLLCVNPDPSVAVAADGIEGANGCVITPDGSTLILAEFGGHRISSFRRGPDGVLGRRELFAPVDDGLFPDGITLDAEGAVWAGTHSGGEFVRVMPGGEIVDRHRPGRGWAVACTFGGPDLGTLYCLCAETTPEGWHERRSTGWIETVELPVGGAPGCP